MDKNFEPIEQLYLSQAFDTESDEEQMLTECKMIARTYALAENAVVSMGDNRRNCSYCYFGGVAECAGHFAGGTGQPAAFALRELHLRPLPPRRSQQAPCRRRLPSSATSPATQLPALSRLCTLQLPAGKEMPAENTAG